jgi:mannose-1-phosphate guanylyltransferase / mannose-6-phosphate isomerase
MVAPNVKLHPTAQPQVSAKRYAIVLAGGSGTRLWPLSRATKPKQLLCLNGEESLLQQTVRRTLPMVEAGHVCTVTSADYRFEVAGQLLALDGALATGVLAEPMGRNTLPAIAWAVARIARETPDALIGVFSSDHAVLDNDRFLRAWQAAEAAAKEGYIALFGMRPTEPATGYGYIQSGQALAAANSGLLSEAYQALRFVEKPDQATAQAYLSAGDYYWNGGMFVLWTCCSSINHRFWLQRKRWRKTATCRQSRMSTPACLIYPSTMVCWKWRTRWLWCRWIWGGAI